MHKNAILPRIAGLIMLLCATVQMEADKRIILLADIHVMGPSLLDSSDNIAWQEELADHRKMQDLSVPIFDLLIERIISEKPDLLFICGDLTKDGEQESHEYVQNKLTEVKDAGIRVYVIPGNHDLDQPEAARIYADNTYTAATSYTDEMFRETYKDFGYGEDSEIHPSSHSYSTELFPGLTLLGIDTGHTAHVRERNIPWITQEARKAHDRGNQILVMAHHSLIPHFYNQESFMVNSVIDTHEQLRDSLMAAGVKVVLTGHYHISDNTRYTNDQGQEIYDICTGSPLSYPCDYRILTFDDQFKQLKITTESVTELEGYDDFPGYAKSRLQSAFQRWATNWFKERSVDEAITSMMSQSIADVYTIHAEGNEPQNPASSEAVALYDDIITLSPLFEGDFADKITELSLSMKSMLGDYPSIEEADNIVDDRELTITMPVLSTGIRQIENHDRFDTPWYTLQGLRLQGKPTKPGIYIHNSVLVNI